MRDNEVLIVEISGKRPGTTKERPTEKIKTRFDHIIISNDSTGYETDWPIINVPKDYRDYYKKNHKISDIAWQAPMNRSYAIKYAKQKKYKYCIQLDDNIKQLCLEYRLNGKSFQTYGVQMFDDFVEMLVCILENTNACQSGMKLISVGRKSIFCQKDIVIVFLH